MTASESPLISFHASPGFVDAAIAAHADPLDSALFGFWFYLGIVDRRAQMLQWGRALGVIEGRYYTRTFWHRGTDSI